MDQKKAEEFMKYYKPEKEELNDEEAKECILQFLFIIYEELKKHNKIDAFKFYDVISLEEARIECIKDLGFVYNLDSIKAYKEAVEEFKRLFCYGPKPQKINNKKQGQVGIIGTALAIFLGICEGLKK